MLVEVGQHRFYMGPEAGAVVHLTQMCQLVHNDIIHNVRRVDHDPPVEVDDSLSLEGFGEDEDGWGFDNDVSFDQNDSSSNAAVKISNPESCNIVKSVESMNDIDPSTNEDEGWGFDDDDDDGWDFED